MAENPRYEEQEPLTPEQVVHFKNLLAERRSKLLAEAEEQLESYRQSGGTRMSDEVDQASAEYDRAFEHRMRDREKGLLKKIDKSLRRMAEGEYDECELCGNYIGVKRLNARPEATLCIECKEEQEQREAKFKKDREADLQFPFK